MTREEAVKRIKQNISAAEFHMGLTQLRSTIENELLDIEAFNMAIEALQVDLVRCGECKHRASGKMGKMCYGRHPDDFCSYGERRSDEYIYKIR